MSNIKETGTDFFNKNAKATLPVKANPANAFQSIFDIQKLDKSEENEIEKLLVDNFRPGENVKEENVPKDIETLKNITSQAKSINKQAILLIGERVFQAREILKNYGDGRGAFTKWLQITFGSRSTAYNSLSYYEFYQSLPHEALQAQLKKMPYKAAYALASRDGSIETKVGIIRDYHQEKAENILPIIQEKLPIAKDSRGKSIDATSALIQKLEQGTNLLKIRRDQLSDENKILLKKIAENIFQITE